MNAFHQIGWLIRKDLALQFRTKDALALIFVFSLLVVLVFSFAFGPIFPEKPEERGKLAAGVLWAAFSFAGVIALNRSFDVERAHGALHGWRLTGVDPSAFYLSKVASNLIFLAMLEVVVTPIALQFLDVLDALPVNLQAQLPQILLKLMGVLAIGTLGFCAVGVIVSSISTSTRGKCTVALLTEGNLGGTFWLSILAAYSLVFLASSFLLFEYVLEG
jgi:heme exporter protein B